MEGKKLLLVVLDGLGDRPIKDLGSKTPLQLAAKSNLDWLASNGACGILDPIAPGVCPGSDTSHLSLLGYDPFQVYTGRGPFEAAGAGIAVKGGDVAFRCNFATVDRDMRVLDRRAGRIKQGTVELAKSLDGLEIEGIEILFKAGTEHRAALVLRGPGLSADVSDTDPHEEGSNILECKAIQPGAEKTARIINEFSRIAHDTLRQHSVNREREEKGVVPANAILIRGGGIFPHLKSIEEMHGMKSAVVAGVALIKGICRSLGMEVLDVKGATGGLDTDMMAKAKAAMDAFVDKDFVLINVKAADICGHDGRPMDKVKVVERADQMLGYIRDHMTESLVLAVTSDHSTPCAVKNHTGDPVPLLIFGEGVRVDDVQTFDEIACAKGGLGRLRGIDLLPLMLDLAGRNVKFGA
jgi:2,3-bisphosphoglycerate-independent phosphoglycerate mutase